MKQNFAECRVLMMSMSSPTGRVQIHLYVTAMDLVIIPLNNGTLKIRARFSVPETRMKNTNAASV
jgi:hypothetical protein